MFVILTKHAQGLAINLIVFFMRYQMTTFAQSLQISLNFNELLAEKAAAQAKVDSIGSRLNEERRHHIPQLRNLIALFEFTAEELFPKPEKKVAVVDKDYSPDYFFRDPETGAEWDGKGKRPDFLRGKKKTDGFRIYHTTGTKFAPVVKRSSVQSDSPSSTVHAPLTVVPTAPPVVAATPAPQSLGVASADHHQPAMTIAAVPVTVDYSTSALQTDVSVEAAAIPS
jgi:DNA-binding protein H-NS